MMFRFQVVDAPTWLRLTSCWLAIATVASSFGGENYGYQPTQPLDTRTIHEVAREIMTSADFRMLNDPGNQSKDASPGFLQRVIDAIEKFLERLFGNMPSSERTDSGAAIGLSQVILATAIALLLVIVIWIVVAVIRSIDARQAARRKGPFGPELDAAVEVAGPPGELATNVYVERAIQLARQGDYRMAIRQLLLGGMSWMERAGKIRFRRGLTNRDYVRAVWRQTPRREAFLQIATNFERVFFGRRAATREMFESCLDSFQKAFRETIGETAKS